MTPQEFLLVLFCTIDDHWKVPNPGRLRRRCSQPMFSNAEPIAIEG